MRQDNRSIPLEKLNALREQAVDLRIDGKKISEIAALTGLSAPTVSAAYKAFQLGGWPAVAVKPRGRKVDGGRVFEPEQEAELYQLISSFPPEHAGLPFKLWQAKAIQLLAEKRFGVSLPARTCSHYLRRWELSAPRPEVRLAGSSAMADWHRTILPGIRHRAEMEHGKIYWVDEIKLAPKPKRNPECTLEPFNIIRAVCSRGKLRWLAYKGSLRAPVLIDFFERLIYEEDCKLFVLLDGFQWQRAASFSVWLKQRYEQLLTFHLPEARTKEGRSNLYIERGLSSPALNPIVIPAPWKKIWESQVKHLMARKKLTTSKYSSVTQKQEANFMRLTHLQRLEAESIHIMREVVAEAENPVMLYSVGKDSAVMLHLARKAFFPAVPPFPLLHVDTRWKFQEMYAFRDEMSREVGMELLVHVNPEGIEKDINPFTHGSAIHTDIMKTEGLKQALDKYGFDAAFGGARRDEEKSRAKERMFSFRSAQHRWDPKNQRPELWKLYNARKNKGESIRVFPLSNWTELDIWQYIYLENIPIVPLYYAAERPVVERDGSLIMVDDDRMPLKPDEIVMKRKVRFRTLGCYPLTGAVESEATTLPSIIQEMLLTHTSERQGRVIDHDSAASMEKKKQEGYF